MCGAPWKLPPPAVQASPICCGAGWDVGSTRPLAWAHHVLKLCSPHSLLSWQTLLFSLGTEARESPGFLISSGAGNSKVSHFSCFIYLQAFPDTSVQKTWLAHISSKTVINWQFSPRLGSRSLRRVFINSSCWQIWRTPPLNLPAC